MACVTGVTCGLGGLTGPDGPGRPYAVEGCVVGALCLALWRARRATLRASGHSSAVRKRNCNRNRVPCGRSVVDGYIVDLLGSCSYDTVAQLAPRLLGGDAKRWERLAVMYGSARQMPVLAPYLPTDAPRLRYGSALQ